MGYLFDLHVHTNRYSPCSRIPPEQLVRQALRAGLDGLAITEHHRQWEEEELGALVNANGASRFTLLAGFEYSSSQGDLLIYGVPSDQVSSFIPGGPPQKAAEMARRLGGVCVAAHPTRAGLGFGERIHEIPLVGIEVVSVNLKEYEQRLALGLAKAIKVPPVACSDAHRLEDVGRYATEFQDPIRSMSDLQKALSRGRFRPADHALAVRGRV